MRRITTTLAMLSTLVAQGCGAPLDGPDGLTGKGDTEMASQAAVPGAACHSIGDQSGGLTCTGSFVPTYVNVWSRACEHNDMLVYRSWRYGYLVCVDGHVQPGATPDPIVLDPNTYCSSDGDCVTEGTPCATLGEGVRFADQGVAFVCHHKAAWELKPAVWADRFCECKGKPVSEDNCHALDQICPDSIGG